MVTLGCFAADDLVPSGHTIASPVKMPVRPSSQVTALPLRLQLAASAACEAKISRIAIASIRIVVTPIVPARLQRESGFVPDASGVLEPHSIGFRNLCIEPRPLQAIFVEISRIEPALERGLARRPFGVGDREPGGIAVPAF